MNLPYIFHLWSVDLGNTNEDVKKDDTIWGQNPGSIGYTKTLRLYP